jgi:uncharacterized protein with GYD domain
MAANGLDDHVEVIVAFDDRNAAQLERQRTLVLVTGREADFGRACRPCRHDAQQADGTCSDDRDAGAGAKLGASERADAHRDRLGEDAEVEADTRRQRPHALLRHGHVLRHAAPSRDPEQRSPRASVRVAASACAALAASHERLDRDRCTKREVDVISHCVDHTGDLVPGDEPVRRRKRSAEEVEVGAADPDGVHADADPVGSGLGNRSLDDLELSSGVPHCRAHRYSFPHVRRRGEHMATYVMLSTLTDEGRKTLKQRPERLDEVNKEVESMGGRVTAQYAMIGNYDFVTVVEAPSNEVVARISVELGSRGTLNITTFPAISVKSFTEMLQNGQV